MDLEHWEDRKNQVLNRLLHASRIDWQLGRDMATVYCASKISTLSAGNKFLYEACKENESFEEMISRWSTGTYENNMGHFRYNFFMLDAFDIDPLILWQYREELERFISPSEEARNRKYFESNQLQ